MDQACRKLAERLDADTRQRVAELDRKHLILPTSMARRKINRNIERKINALSTKLQNSLQASLDASMARSERVSDRAIEGAEGATFAAALVTGGGAILGVGGAAVAATTTTTVGFWIFAAPVVTFSWPVFAVGAAGAVSLAALSPKLMDRAAEVRRGKIAEHLAGTIDERLLGSDPKAKNPSIRATLLLALDKARDARLAALEQS